MIERVVGFLGAASRRERGRSREAAAAGVAAARVDAHGGVGVAYLIAAPPSADLAAASYRSDLFGRAGFTLWDNGWYGGHHLPAYACSRRRSAGCSGRGCWRAVGDRRDGAVRRARRGRFAARAPRAWRRCGLRSARRSALLSGRVTFDLGLARLGALARACYARRPRRRAAATRGVALAAAAARWRARSPGGFLALAAVAWGLAGPRARRAGARAGSRPRRWRRSALLALAFPEGGTQPFVGVGVLPGARGVLLIAAAAAGRAARAAHRRAAVRAALIGAFVAADAGRRQRRPPRRAGRRAARRRVRARWAPAPWRRCDAGARGR